MVTFALPTAAPDLSVTVPSNVAFTAWPLAGAENAARINVRTIAKLRHPNLTKPRLAKYLNANLSTLDSISDSLQENVAKSLLIDVPPLSDIRKTPLWTRRLVKMPGTGSTT